MRSAAPGSASIVLVTPALADANNGNWQTARRWARLLAPLHRVEIADHWAADPVAAGRDAQLLIALHARRSAASILAWKMAHPDRPLIVALTGTDLYRDIGSDPAAQHSLALADRLIVLNELGARALPETMRDKVRVVLQSCTQRRPRARAESSGRKRLRVLMVGHLRPEKDPATYQRAALRLAHRTDVHLDHIGRALQPELADAAQACMQQQPRYRWLGGLPHAATRDRLARAQLLVHASRMEGGAHAVIEALRSGVPVLASAIDGNLGLLGTDYAGTFAAGDDAALARLIERFADEPAFAAQLRAQCAARADRFSPEAEAAALRAIVAELLG